MSNPYQSTSDAKIAKAIPPDAEAGRTFIVVLIVVNTLLALSVIGYAAAVGENDRLPRLALRLVVNIALMYGLWNGTRWIKWLFVLGLFLTALFLALWMIRLPIQTTLLIAPLTAVLAWASFNLAFGTSVDEFLTYQRDKDSG